LVRKVTGGSGREGSSPSSWRRAKIRVTLLSGAAEPEATAVFTTTLTVDLVPSETRDSIMVGGHGRLRVADVSFRPVGRAARSDFVLERMAGSDA